MGDVPSMYPPLVNHHWYILLPSAVLCFNSHPQENSRVWKKSTCWKWGSPCCKSFLVGPVRRCSVHSPCCICSRLSFYQLFFCYSIVFPGIITAALAPCSSQFLHVFNRRSMTWSHILSVNTNPFLSDNVPALSYTYTICESSSGYCFPTWFTGILPRVVITTIFNSGYRINSLWICASILLGIQWTMGNAHLSRWWQTVTVTLILGFIACLALNCDKDIATATARNRGYRIWKWVKIVRWTCDRGCGALTNDQFCGKAGGWVKRKQDGRLWRKLFLWTSDIRTELCSTEVSHSEQTVNTTLSAFSISSTWRPPQEDVSGKEQMSVDIESTEHG